LPLDSIFHSNRGHIPETLAVSGNVIAASDAVRSEGSVSSGDVTDEVAGDVEEDEASEVMEGTDGDGPSSIKVS
jgi:hypothetical protein